MERDGSSRSIAETLAAGRKGGNRNRQGGASDDVVSAWFVREIIPLEAVLMSYLRHNWKNASDIADLRQEIYVRTFDAARDHIPDNAKRFLFMTARNLLIDLVRREQVVPMESVADMESFEVASDEAGPDRAAVAKGEVRRLLSALDKLPPRAREAVILTYVEDLRVREIATRMGVARSTVSTHLANGLRALMDILHGSEDSEKP